MYFTVIDMSIRLRKLSRDIFIMASCAFLLLPRRGKAFLVAPAPISFPSGRRTRSYKDLRARIEYGRHGLLNISPATLFSTIASSSVPENIDKEGHVRENKVENKNLFEVTANYEPAGDQPKAIEQLTRQIREGDKYSVLRGITGTGKTFVMSHVIANIGKPTLVLCHNKTLAAQLARELRSFLSKNAVELFVSYYNHYVPESFVETTGKYIAKKSSVNSDIDVLRHRATRALLSRRDVVVVASVSCIYGLGLPKEYLDASLEITVGDNFVWEELLEKLHSMLYTYEEDHDSFARGHYQVSELFINGKVTRTITVWLPHDKFPMQIDFEEDARSSRVAAIKQGSQRGTVALSFTRIFPARHHVTSPNRLGDACLAIEDELRERTSELLKENKVVEAERLHKRVSNDLVMLRKTGFCQGGENYSRHFAGRGAGDPPDTLMDYLGLNGSFQT